MCLDRVDSDAWISDAERAQDEIQVGTAAWVNNPGDISWRTTEWSAGREDVAKAKVATRAGESREQPASTLRGKTVTSDLQRVALREKDDGQLRVWSNLVGSVRMIKLPLSRSVLSESRPFEVTTL